MSQLEVRRYMKDHNQPPSWVLGVDGLSAELTLDAVMRKAATDAAVSLDPSARWSWRRSASTTSVGAGAHCM